MGITRSYNRMVLPSISHISSGVVLSNDFSWAHVGWVDYPE